ncbi:MAG: SAM-dependent methyltransferase [Clostridia bacterium]|nr:SAM-dependent methyltransferase [Clostridia bacterium]
MNITPELQKITELTVTAAKLQRLKKAVLSKPQDKSLQKVVLTLKKSSRASILQAEYFHKDNKVTHKNFELNETTPSALNALAEGFSQFNLICSDGECEYKCSSSGKTVLLGADKLERKLCSVPTTAENTVLPTSNNREKQYILNGSEPFLKHLGVADGNGRVFDRKQAKFRQINRFLELIRDVEDKLPRNEIRICDLCCGKSYLSFAVYHYFANIKNFRVSMTGVDLKPDVVAHCNAVAKALNFEGLEFLCGDVREYESPTPPSLVISLHACDIATDFVLDKAVSWNTDVILSTPCCHHELNHHIDCPTLSFISDYSMLRQKLCDAATDAIRLCKLETFGYTTTALELIDPDETPKNIMLRAIRKKNFDPTSEEARKANEKYNAAKEFFCGSTPKHTFHF